MNNRNVVVCVGGALLLSTVFITQSRAATDWYSWADEFVTGSIECGPGDGAGLCYEMSEFDGNFWDSYVDKDVQTETWAVIGQQTIAGHANARSKLNSRLFFRNGSSTCFQTTNDITRYRQVPAPAVGSVCSNTIGSGDGIASQTLSTCGLAAGDSKTFDRLLPVLDFSTETSTGVIGYREQLSSVNTTGGSAVQGCFAIYWF